MSEKSKKTQSYDQLNFMHLCKVI